MNPNLNAAKRILNGRNYVDFTVTQVACGESLVEYRLAPAYGVGRVMHSELEKLAKRVEFVPTRRSTKRNPRTLPVFVF